jgi:hypothetical protein
MDILKDSCNPVYGSRGAAGVIIVSTKKIKQGEHLLNIPQLLSIIFPKKLEL